MRHQSVGKFWLCKHCTVFASSTHWAFQQTDFFGRFTIDRLCIDFGIQCTVDQVFESLSLSFGCRKLQIKFA